MKKDRVSRITTQKYVPYAMTRDIVTDMFPVEMEPKIPTMDKPLMIESACPGFQMGGARFPAVPIKIADQIKAQVDSLKAGAVIAHVHARDPKTGEAQMNHKLLTEVLDGIFSKVGDRIVFTHSWYPVPNSEVDCIIGTQELLELGNGNKYVQGSLLVPVGYRVREQSSYVGVKGTIEGIKWLERHGVKPVYQLIDTYSHLGFKRYVFDRGIAKSKPHILNIQIGKHEATATNRDPWSHLQLITSMNMIKENVPGSIIGVYPGGRNWLPMVVTGILLGADIVRVGIEDCYWLYPHKDEIIKKNSDVVRMTVDLASMLGRRVVTDPKEARKILGMKLTSRL
jgi:3-keto-5-aminohexanoate cleavage enzyme